MDRLGQQLVLMALGATLLVMPACGESAPPEPPQTPLSAIETPDTNEVAEAYFAKMKALIALLDSIRDPASAKAAATQLETATQEVKDAQLALEALPDEEKQGYGQAFQVLDQHLTYQLRRITSEKELAETVEAARKGG